MRDTMVEPPFCSVDAGECGFPLLAPLVHVGFQIVSAFMLTNLVISVVLEQFEEVCVLLPLDRSEV